MIAINTNKKNILQGSSQALAFFLEQDFENKALKDVAQALFPALSSLMKKRNFNGRSGSSLVVSCCKKETPIVLILLGLGSPKQKKVSVEAYRRAVARAVRIAQDNRCGSLALQLPQPKIFGLTDQGLGKETTIAAQMAAYHFDEYITDKERKIKDLIDVELFLDGHDEKELQCGIKEGSIIAESVNLCRFWIDLPPVDLCPPKLAKKAQDIASGLNIKCTIFNESEVNQMGMGGLAAVSRGSDRDCQLAILEYRTKKKDAKTICLVGKGITFDSGGLSLKPANYMETMKDDMAGAAAVIATMQAIALLKPSINVIGITPLAENLPSGKATKPGDIITFYNGKTAEVQNTDAEGRLILADALSYAVKQYTCDAIVDIATLTGACSYALGPFFSGLMSQHDDLAEKLQKASERTGDRIWQLPMDDDYKPAIKSPVADIANSGSSRYRAGAITAAFFLQNFVDTVPWAHLDIAGTAFDVPDIPYYRTFGATGAGVRLLIDFVMNWK